MVTPSQEPAAITASNDPVGITLSPNVDLRQADADDISRLDARKKLKPRKKLQVTQIDRPTGGNLVIKVKFDDTVLARSDGADGVSLIDNAAARTFSRFAAEHELSFQPEMDLNPALLDRVEARAAERSGIAQPDLRGMFYVATQKAQTIDEAHAIIAALDSQPVTEYASVQSLN